MKCRHCGAVVEHKVLDLGHAPPSNAYLERPQLDGPEITYPLRIHVCHHCWLVQTEDFAHAQELFRDDYAYFSSTSRTWCEHAARFFEAATDRFALGAQSFVIELGSNDGYLLRHFVAAGIPCLGIEPTASTADAAALAGIPVHRAFFGQQVASELAGGGVAADLVVANNVFAHVPDVNDFSRGLKLILKSAGTICLEFPHLLRLLQDAQFDTVYHEHFSYISLYSACRILERAGLRVFNVEELSTHGGSLRLSACHADNARKVLPVVGELLEREARAGLCDPEIYDSLQGRTDRIKNGLIAFLIEEKRKNRTVAAYGAAAKGNTLLNYAGIRPDLIQFVCDAAPSKQRKYLPGSHIPILAPSALLERRPDVLLILPWNIAGEIAADLDPDVTATARLFVAVPELKSIDIP